MTSLDIAAELAGVASSDDPDGYMAACSALNRLVTDAEHRQWLADLDRGYYEDEAPTDDTLMYDGPLFGPTWEDLDHLMGQRAACLNMPETLAGLDREIAETRRVLEGV